MRQHRTLPGAAAKRLRSKTATLNRATLRGEFRRTSAPKTLSSSLGELHLRVVSVGGCWIVFQTWRFSLGFQELEQFCARHEQLAAKCPASLEFSALNQSVNAEIIDAKQIGGFLH